MLYVTGSASISYFPAIRNNAVMRDEIIKNYFNLGFTAPEIALFLVSAHGIGISLRQFNRILRRLGCTRRRRRSNLNEVVEAIEEELRGKWKPSRISSDASKTHQSARSCYYAGSRSTCFEGF